jgi:hypothetical protein
VKVYLLMYHFASDVVNLCPAANKPSSFLSSMDCTSLAVNYALTYGGVVISNSSVYFNIWVSSGYDSLYDQEYQATFHKFSEVCSRFNRFSASDECVVNTSDFSCYMREPPRTFEWFIILLIVSASIVLLKELVKVVLIVYILTSRREPSSLYVYPFISSSVFCPLLLMTIPYDNRIVQKQFRKKDLLLVFFADGILENLNQLCVTFLYVYDVSGTGITFSTMLSVFMNVCMILFSLVRVVVILLIELYGEVGSASVGVEVTTRAPQLAAMGTSQQVAVRRSSNVRRISRRSSLIVNAFFGVEN